MTNLPITWPPAGRYLLAVSGGADSMVLLDVMVRAAGERGYQLSVGHVDHGLRPESAADRQFVEAAANHYGVPFAWHEAKLPPGASEAAARQARHAWLQAEAARRGAAVVTAHHQDDLLETSLLNLARGTGRHGLAPMQTGTTLRPLLAAARAGLRQYAHVRQLAWREDPTNADQSNPRNLLRHSLLAGVSPSWKSRYLAAMTELAALNSLLDGQIHELIKPFRQNDLCQNDPAAPAISWPRALWQSWSLGVAAEVVRQAVLELAPEVELNRRLIKELALFAKTAPPGRRRPVTPSIWLLANDNKIDLISDVM